MQMYVDGIDFCISSGFPTNDDLKQVAGDIINQYGVYINQQFRLQDRSFIVALADCVGDVACGGYNVSQLFVKDQSSIQAVASGNSFLVIDCFDQSTVSVQAGDEAKVLINVYGNSNVTHAASGNARIKIVNKLKDTY
jgi:hypothetical protein